MAVQAHYPSNNALPPDFSTSIRAPDQNQNQGNALLQLQDGRIAVAAGLIGFFYPPNSNSNPNPNPNPNLNLNLNLNVGKRPIANRAVLSEPGSDLTTFNKEDDAMVLPQSNPDNQQQPPRHHQMPQPFRFAAGAQSIIVDPTGLQLPFDLNNRLQGSAGTSTSGRPAASPLHHHHMEIEALIRLQSQELRSGMEEIRKRHCKELVGLMGQQAAKRMRVKEAELDAAKKRNADLEAKIKQIAAENQVWFNVARNHEIVAAKLKASLDQLLCQNNAGGCSAPEGYGESDGAADDAESCCGGRDEEEEAPPLRRRTCRACRGKDVSVMLLPCRHLCLCGDCESGVDTCPICYSAKNGSLEVFLS